TGRIGIGNVTDPQAKLHIRADEGEDASLLLESTSANKSAVIMLGENHQIAARADNNLLFTSSESAGFAFENGSFRVGTGEQPQQISLHGSINAEGLLATAFGEGNIASGNYSFVGGENSKANGRSSYSFGQRTNVYDNYALGIGRYLEVYGSSSIAIGRFLKTLNPDAMVIGYGFSETQTLDNNVNRSLMIGFESTKPTFFVGPSNGINSTGRIGIGNVTDPQAKLHIRADALEDASLLLEASAGGQAKVILSESHEITYETDENLHFRTAQSKAFVFHQGDIFIEDIQSGIIMRSPNGQCWRGRVNDQGLLAFEQTECPTAETSLPEFGRVKHLMRVYPNPASKLLEVVAESLNGLYTLRIISATGQLMLEQQSRVAHTRLNIQNMPSGNYLLVLEQDGQMKDSVKVLVE
ncbi:MAG: T9SS type A sorting domain-containing protein, partial [Bacteroidales bacterium]|nr:T9SS type A sorting domain-containing protein [Bacteroidales bacterium]